MTKRYSGAVVANRREPTCWYTVSVLIAIAVGVAGCTVVVVPQPLPAATSLPQAPTVRVIDATVVESDVRTTLSDAYGIQGVGVVTCPTGLPAAAGATFTCTTVIDGMTLTVPVRITTTEGDYEVGRPT